MPAERDEYLGSDYDWDGESDAVTDDGDPTTLPEPEVILDPEVWMDCWSEELWDMWHVVTKYRDSLGLNILDACEFPDFAEFCFRRSSGRPNKFN